MWFSFYGVVAKSEPILIIMEYVNGGSLDVYLQKHAGKLPIADLIRFCADAACGIEFLHTKQCIHRLFLFQSISTLHSRRKPLQSVRPLFFRDIAARNCLVHFEKDDSAVIKIGDFGLCRKESLYKMDMSKKAPIRWLAPETLRQGHYTFRSDLFSYGILVWEIFMDGAEPYSGYSFKLHFFILPLNKLFLFH